MSQHWWYDPTAAGLLLEPSAVPALTRYRPPRPLDLERVELWTDVELNGGVLIGVVRGMLSLSESAKIDGEHNLDLTVSAAHPLITLSMVGGLKNLRIDQVLRLVLTDGSYTEHRIGSAATQGQAGRYVRRVTARSILQDLGFRCRISRSTADGASTCSFEALGLTMAQHIAAFLLPALAAKGQPFWAIGTMAHSRPVDMVYDRDTPLSALRKLCSAGAMEGGDLELAVVRTEGGYEIQLLQQIGQGLQPIVVRSKRNLLDLGLVESESDQATSVATFGADDQGVKPTLGQATWDVGAVTGVADAWVIKLADPAGGPGPIKFDDQFVRDPVPEDPADNYHLTWISADYVGPIIASSAANQTVTLGSTAAPPAGVHRAKIAADVNGRENLEVEHPLLAKPASEGGYGVRVGYLDCPDIAATDNLVPNALGRVWPSGSPLPTGWLNSVLPGFMDIGARVEVSRETDAKLWQHGGQSIRCRWPTSNIDAALICPTIILPLRAQGYLSYYAVVTTLTGKIQVSIVIKERDTDYAGAATPSLPYTGGAFSRYYKFPVQSGELTTEIDSNGLPLRVAEQTNIELNTPEEIGVGAFWDLSKTPLYGGSAWIIVEPSRDAFNAGIETIAIVEMMQLTVSDHQMPKIEGNGGVKLHQAANNRLGLYSTPAPAVTVSPFDLAFSDRLRLPYDRLRPGVPLRIEEPDVDVSLGTRLVGYSRDWARSPLPTIEVSNLRPDITRLLATRPRAARHQVDLVPRGVRGFTFAA